MLLPTPDAPMIATISPASTVRSRSRSTGSLRPPMGYDFDNPRTSRKGMATVVGRESYWYRSASAGSMPAARREGCRVTRRHTAFAASRTTPTSRGSMMNGT